MFTFLLSIIILVWGDLDHGDSPQMLHLSVILISCWSGRVSEARALKQVLPAEQTVPCLDHPIQPILWCWWSQWREGCSMELMASPSAWITRQNSGILRRSCHLLQRSVHHWRNPSWLVTEPWSNTAVLWEPSAELPNMSWVILDQGIKLNGSSSSQFKLAKWSIKLVWKGWLRQNWINQLWYLINFQKDDTNILVSTKNN